MSTIHTTCEVRPLEVNRWTRMSGRGSAWTNYRCHSSTWPYPNKSVVFSSLSVRSAVVHSIIDLDSRHGANSQSMFLSLRDLQGRQNLGLCPDDSFCARDRSISSRLCNCRNTKVKRKACNRWLSQQDSQKNTQRVSDILFRWQVTRLQKNVVKTCPCTMAR